MVIAYFCYHLYFHLAVCQHYPSTNFFCSVPFSVDDISKSTDQIEVTDVDPPPLIRENSGFAFLLQRSNDWNVFDGSFLTLLGTNPVDRCLHIEVSRILLANDVCCCVKMYAHWNVNMLLYDFVYFFYFLFFISFIFMI